MNAFAASFIPIHAIDHADLDALIVTVDDCPQFAPSLLAWIEHICDWEQHRRAGHEIQLHPPEAAIDPSEDAAAIGGALLLRASLGDTGPAVTALLDAIVAQLTAGGRRH